jgi:hypothetical protein
MLILAEKHSSRYILAISLVVKLALVRAHNKVENPVTGRGIEKQLTYWVIPAFHPLPWEEPRVLKTYEI